MRWHGPGHATTRSGETTRPRSPTAWAGCPSSRTCRPGSSRRPPGARCSRRGSTTCCWPGWAARASSPRSSPAAAPPIPGHRRCTCSTRPIRRPSPASAVSCPPTGRCTSPRPSRVRPSRPAATSRGLGAPPRPRPVRGHHRPGKRPRRAGGRPRLRRHLREPARHRRPLLGAVVLRPRPGAAGWGRRRRAARLGRRHVRPAAGVGGRQPGGPPRRGDGRGRAQRPRQGDDRGSRGPGHVRPLARATAGRVDGQGRHGGGPRRR